MKCPICVDESLVMADRQGIEIDYCAKCRGIWLDRGELDKIIERSSADRPPVERSSDERNQSEKYNREPSYKQSGSYAYPKKKKSILSEIFDF